VERLSESGVDVSGVKCLSGKNTGVTVILPLAKKRQILTYRAPLCDLQRHISTWTTSAAPRTFISHPFFFCGRCAPRCRALSQMKQAGLTTSLDTTTTPENLGQMTLRLVLKKRRCLSAERAGGF